MAVARTFGHLNNYKTASVKFRTCMPDHSKFMQEQQTEFDCSYLHLWWSEGVGAKGVNRTQGQGQSIPHSLLIQIWGMARWQEDLALGSLQCWISLSLIAFEVTMQLRKLPVDLHFVLPGKPMMRFCQSVTSCVLHVFLWMDLLACLVTTMKSSVLKSTIPTHGLNKRHNFLACHHVRECIDATHKREPIVRFSSSTLMARRTRWTSRPRPFQAVTFVVTWSRRCIGWAETSPHDHCQQMRSVNWESKIAHFAAALCLLSWTGINQVFVLKTWTLS